MANYNTLKSDIQNDIKQNGANLITGQLLQQNLLAMINSLGAGYQYKGVADPVNTNPGTPDYKCFYIASEAGTYTNFLDSNNTPLEVNDGEVAILKWDAAWSKEVTGAATAAQVTELGQQVITQISQTLPMYDSALINKKVNSDGTISDNNGTYVTDFIPLNNSSGDSIYWKHGSVPGSCCLCIYDSSKTRINDYGRTGEERTITLSVSAAYVRATFNMYLDSAILKNVTQNKVLYQWNTQTEQAIESIKLFDFLSEDSSWLQQIYSSKSDNYLDVKNVLHGIFFDSKTDGTITKDKDGVLSRFIYVGDAQKITISGYVASAHLGVAFFDEAKLETAHKLSYYSATNTQRTINVPSGAKYAVVCLVSPNFNAEYDYSGVKVSKGSSATTDEYSPEYIGQAGFEYLWGKTIATENDLNGIFDKQLYHNDSVSSGGFSIVVPYIASANSDVLYKIDGTLNIVQYQFYVKYEGDNDFTSLFAKPFVNGQIERYVPDANIIAIQIYVGSAYITSTGSVNFYDCRSMQSEIQLLKEVTPDDEYQAVFEQICNDGILRFIPYSSTTAANAVSEATDALIKNFNFVFFTDSHVDMSTPEANLQNVQDVVTFTNKQNSKQISVGGGASSYQMFDAVLNAGDIITPHEMDSKSKNLAEAKKFFDRTEKLTCPFLFCAGNHDRNDYNNIPANVFTDEDWATLYGNYAETNYGIVRQTKANGKKSQWFYRDFPSKKIRVISVYSNDVDYSAVNSQGFVLYNEGRCWYIAQEQMAWLVNTALNFDDKDELDWGVIVLIHLSKSVVTGVWKGSANGIEPEIESSIYKFFQVCKAFNTQSTYSDSYTYPTDTFFNLSINADFTRYANEEKKPYMICWMNGHDHLDYNSVEDGMNLIWTAQGAATMFYSDKRNLRVIGGATQNLFDLVSVDTTHRKIRIVRIGQGVNAFGAGKPYGDRFIDNGLAF